MPPWDVPVWIEILLMPGHRRGALLQRGEVDLHERGELLGRRVLAAHLADLAADRHRDAARLAVANEEGELGAAPAVRLLLRLVPGLGEVHQRRSVHVDVVEAGLDRLGGQIAHRLQLALGVRRVLLRVHLEVIALDEYRSAPAFAQRGRQHHEHVLGRTPGRCRRSRNARSRRSPRRRRAPARAEQRAGGVVGEPRMLIAGT
jgi:hypothetical protein